MEVAELAERQHGAVSLPQLLELGLTRRQVEGRIASAVLHPVHRGVYAVGHAWLTLEGRWMAAVLAGGAGSALSTRSAGMHWLLLRRAPSWPEITRPRRFREQVGIRAHTARLRADEVTVRNGIPVTTVARTILDLAGCLDRHRLERVIAEAEYRRYADSPSLRELIERHRGRRGVGRLRSILAAGDAERGPTRSPLEARFLRFLDARHLERPELNAPLHLEDRTIFVDCMWRRQRIAVELDGRAAHLRTRTWEEDRVRDRALLVAGWQPVRVTSEQLDSSADRLDADLRALGVRAR